MKCANCDSSPTEKVYQHQERDWIEQVWICEDCNAEFEAKFSLFDKELTDMGKELVNNDG